MKLSKLAKEVWCYNVLFINGSWPKPINKQGTKVTVGTVAAVTLLMNRPLLMR